MESIKNWIIKHKYQTIGIIGTAMAVIAAFIVVVIITNKKEVPKETNKIEASAELTTSMEPSYDGETTAEIEKETTTKEQATTTKEEETTTKKQESTPPPPVYTLPTTQTPTTSIVQPTTQKPIPPTTVQPPTSPAVSTPKRGENGVILEELDLILKISGEVPVPKTKEIMEQYMKSTGYREDSGLKILYNSPDVQQQNIFNNELKFSSTTIAQLKAIYGEPVVSYTSDSGNKFLVYQYGKYANGKDKQTIYIRFGFSASLKYLFGAVAIGNKKDLGLEDYIN